MKRALPVSFPWNNNDRPERPSRSLARQVCTIVQPARTGDTRRKLVYHQIAFVHALRQHLRGLSPFEEWFMFQTLDKSGCDLEDPFDNTIHDVSMTAYRHHDPKLI